MKNGIAKPIIFFAYTLCIYFFSTITGLLLALILCDGKMLHDILELTIKLIYVGLDILWVNFIELFYKPENFGAVEILIAFIFLMCLCILYSTPVIFWFVKQTLFRASLVSLLGLVAGPGIVFFHLLSIDEERAGAALTISMVFLTYLLLCIGNKAQKKYYPENRFANRLRELLKAPCLRT